MVVGVGGGGRFRDEGAASSLVEAANTALLRWAAAAHACGAPRQPRRWRDFPRRKTMASFRCRRAARDLVCGACGRSGLCSQDRDTHGIPPLCSAFCNALFCTNCKMSQPGLLSSAGNGRQRRSEKPPASATKRAAIAQRRPPPSPKGSILGFARGRPAPRLVRRTGRFVATRPPGRRKWPGSSPCPLQRPCRRACQVLLDRFPLGGSRRGRPASWKGPSSEEGAESREKGGARVSPSAPLHHRSRLAGRRRMSAPRLFHGLHEAANFFFFFPVRHRGRTGGLEVAGTLARPPCRGETRDPSARRWARRGPAAAGRPRRGAGHRAEKGERL